MSKEKSPFVIRKLLGLLKITRENLLVYQMVPSQYPLSLSARVHFDFQIKKLTPWSSQYFALIDGKTACQCRLLEFNSMLWQFGYGITRVIGDCETDPAYRGMGLYPALLSHLILALKNGESPDKPVYIIVYPENTPSIKGIEKAGFKFAFQLHAFRLGPILIKKRTDATPQEH